MTIPAFLFGSLVAALLGSIFHLWKGGKFGYWVFYILVSLAGFWAGHFLAVVNTINILKVGPIQFGPALLGTLIFLFIGRWLVYFQDHKVK